MPIISYFRRTWRDAADGLTRGSDGSHFVWARDYGHTKRGAFICKADAQAAGNRAAKIERQRGSPV
jgi:hypothetical protein